MTPSVGRIVHYVARGSADGMFPSICRAAIITEIDNPDTPEFVDIAVINPTGVFFHENCEFDGIRNYPGTWHWPEIVK